MSQTETLMLVALGFALALLVALLFGRALWNIAVTLGARRNAKNIPVQMLELQADRDRLRAEHAMMARKLELRLEDIKSRMTEQMAEVSRNRNRVQSLIQQLEEREATLAIRDREVANMTSQIDVQKSELDSRASTIARLSQDTSAKDQEIAKLAQNVSQLTLNLREKNGMVGRLNEELQTTLQMNKLGPQQAKGAEPGDDKLKRRIAELTSISAEMSNHDHSNVQTLQTPLTNPPAVDVPSRQSILNGKVLDTERESEAMTLELKALDEMLDKKLGAPNAQAPEKKSGSKANIISLAQRIRALQGGGSGE
jgi:chromosome segregation ATPase